MKYREFKRIFFEKFREEGYCIDNDTATINKKFCLLTVHLSKSRFDESINIDIYLFFPWLKHKDEVKFHYFDRFSIKRIIRKEISFFNYRDYDEFDVEKLRENVLHLIAERYSTWADFDNYITKNFKQLYTASIPLQEYYNFVR